MSTAVIPNSSRNTILREPMSCERCKSRKLKCNRQRPSCHGCSKSNVTCTYTARKKPGFPAGERQSLEDKIARLEGELRRSREGTNKSAESGQSEDVSSVARSLPPQELPASQNPEVQPVATLQRTRSLTERDPPKDLVFSAASLFFHHVHSWIPFLDIQRVFSDLGSMSSTSVPLLYYALFGVSIPYSYDPRLDQISSDSFWAFSKRRIFIDILEEPSLKSLEALTILVLDLSGMTNGPQVWGALSIAVKFSAQLKSVGDRTLRISAEEFGEKMLDSTDQIYRRKLFWAIYALDSYITITTGHTSDMDPDYIKYFLPSRNTTWRGLEGNLESSLTPAFVFNFQLELLDISRKVHSLTTSLDFYEPETFISCSTELSAWFQNLPPCLALTCESNQRSLFSHTTPPALLMLHAYYHAIVIHLHGSLVYPGDRTADSPPIAQQENESRWRCAQSFDALSAIASQVSKPLHDRLGWPFGWALWVACRYILIRNYNDELRDMTTFYTLLECLKSSSRYWQISGKYWRLLNQAAAEYVSGHQARPGRTSNSQNLLLAVVDQRIPTSDLEDRSRPDPVISTTTVAAGEPNLFEIKEIMSNFESVDAEERMESEFRNSSIPETFDMSQLTSDNWFTTSLFASSGYQH